MKNAGKLLIAIVFIILFLLIYPNLAPLVDDIDALRSTLAPFGWLASLTFIVISIIAGILFLPLSAFAVAGGILFGTLWGLLLVLFAATISAALAFLIARQFSDLVPRAKKGFIQKLQRAIERRLHKNTFQTIFVLRLLYLPYIGLSFAAGLVRTCKFWPFVWATFFTNIVGSFVFVYFGDQLGRGIHAFIIPAILIALSMLIPYIIKKFVKKKN